MKLRIGIILVVLLSLFVLIQLIYYGLQHTNPPVIRMFIIVSIVVAVTDLIFYTHLKQHPEHLTLPYVLMVIAITLIPIWINFWYHQLR